MNTCKVLRQLKCTIYGGGSELLDANEHLHAVRSKCEHAVAIRMLAFRSDYVHLLRLAKPIFQIWTSRFRSRPLAIFRSLFHATVKYLEILNARIAILEIAV